MTWLKQCDTTYVRRYPGIGYVYNQLTRLDRVYDEVGATFLASMSRVPRDLDEVVLEVAEAFPEIPGGEVQARFREFVASLEADGYVTTGEGVEELERKEVRFSYRREHPRTELTKTDALPDTADFFYEHFQRHPRIFRIHIDVTSRCNESCVHCYLPTDRQRQDIDTDLALDVLGQLGDLGALSVTFSGGEPFLHEDFDQLLRAARANDLTITVLTNGTGITEEHLHLLREVNVDEVQFSLYSMDPEVHDAVTGLPGSHERTLGAIERTIEADVPANISCPLMKLNYRSHEAVMLWALERKMRVTTDFILMGCMDFEGQNLEGRLSLPETEDLIRRMLRYNEHYRSLLDRRETPVEAETLRDKAVCGAGIDTVCLGAGGDYYFCPLFRKRVGNAYRDRLESVWNNSHEIREVRRIRWSDFSECLECEAFHFCSMCFARNFTENAGDPLKINRRCCAVAFLNKRLVEEYWQENNPRRPS